MKYLMLLVLATLVLVSCDCDDDFDFFNEQFDLESFSKIACDDPNNDFSFDKNSDQTNESDLEPQGTLKVELDGTFDLRLKITSNENSSLLIEEQYTGSLFKSIEKEEWIVENCISNIKNKETECDDLNFSITDDMLTWSFENKEDCTIILKWNKK